ncbi:Trehalose-phosphate phosphatase [Glycine soja]|uniref:Trehalose 6-phosphate phosphatase n=1 Tax=Glycine soja TaxID=3848 RepID=A0A0B2RFF2_GLYSO|nr:Trehalose-phosphate phosphatase [Glycine soja]
MAAKKHDAGDTKKRKRPNTETHEDPKASNLIASKKHKLDSVAKDNKNKKTMRATLKGIARHFPTAIVTGRCRDKNNNNNKAVLFQSASQFLPMIDEVYEILLEKMKTVPGAKVENNKFCLSLHFRCVDKKSWAALVEKVRLVLNENPQLRLTQGRKVLEIRPTIKWDKGKAHEFLLESLGYKNLNDVFPIYIGDDRTDEDAFRVTNAATPSLLVS